MADEVDRGAALSEFGAATREWFAAAFAAPTAAQAGAWRSVAAGRNALVVAPTGSGKTLAAFLWSLDKLAKEPPPAEARHRCRVLYVSPLKALAVDVERNLRAPLTGIRQAATRLGLTPPDITVGMRTGDTPADERRAFARTPPDILITTPESLFLLLTSAARDSLRGVRTVIVDEVHAVAGTKRGAHLALSLERLDALLETPAQRIGLSATVRPIDVCARFLGGARPVDVVQPASSKTIEVSVQVPVEDMTRLDEQEPEDDLGGPGPRRASIWPAVEERVFSLIRAHRSTIVFTNSRRSAERLCARLNELAAEEIEASLAPDGSRTAGGGQPVRVAELLSGPDGPPPGDGGPADGPGPASHDGTTTGGPGPDRRDGTTTGGPGPGSGDGPTAGDAGTGSGGTGRRRGGPGGGGFGGPVGPLRAPRQPAEVMAQAGAAAGAPPVIARAHHGSVSREERKHIEEALKSGQLPAVVATSSLELGIDMGAVDLVVQIEAPPSVAAGLQRVGRAGHQVGAVSRGVVFPKHRGDLLSCTVVAERMAEGAIEELHYPRNPLDVLAQQIVAMVALEPWRLGDLAVLVRRAAPFAELPDSALHAVLDMLSGRYPSTAFAELRPRLVWDRATDVLTGRPGAQRLAVTSGGTIPDRGMFGVFLAGAERAARVGELDEEMVYESRVGDVFLLGSSSWRIEEITPDRVLVSPAPGQAARMPFWKGDQLGRPVELGRAIGARVRALLRQSDTDALAALRAGGLDDWAAGNLLAYLREQKTATRSLPDDRTVVVERFRDELGDWRLAVHSVLGARVNGPWALAIGRRLAERYGVDAQVMPSDDGIVVRLPDTAEEPPGADVVAFEPDEIAQLVEESVGTSALFASRFRECAARSLLLPRRDPRRRQPLWQQRQRAAQLLDVAREYADFPVTLEAARECLQDVFDQPALAQLMRDLAARKVRLVEVESERPSPFARSLLFGYVGAFLYEGDAPLAERRAAALALDSGLLGELLGRVDLRELLDPAVLAETERQLRWLTEQRRPRDAEDVVELLRVVGDLSEAELAERGVPADWLTELVAARRVLPVRIAGEERWTVIEDAARLRDALGVALPVGVAEAYLAPVADPLGDLVTRYARTHGPFAAASCAARFGLGVYVVEQALRRLAGSGRVVSGEFAPDSVGTQWCDAEVLRLLRRRSLAALRREIEPVPPRALARFLPRWQQVGSSARGVEALAAAVEQVQGVAVPASALERLVLPARVADYSPAQLDELCASGEVVWAGAGAISGGDGWVTLAYADVAPLLLPPPDDALTPTPLHEALLDALGDGQALFFRSLSDRVGSTDDTALAAALWDLVWAGHLTNDTLAPLRAALGGGGAHRSRPSAPRTRYRRPGRVALPARSGPPTVAGRWSRLPERDLDPTRRAAALADLLLERHGVVTRGAVVAEQVTGGFAGVYPVLSALEERGAARRGYFVEGLGAAQFAVPGAVDRLRALADPADGGRDRGGPAVVLAATDPANPYGAALPWPDRVVDSGDGSAPATGHRAGRKAGALVVLVGGDLALYVERGGRTILSFTDEPDALTAAGKALADAVHSGALGAISVERADGEAVHSSPLRDALTAAGFRPTPRGLRLRS
ncbi:ATP dependent helicase, Lhr family [Micromonospora auratinigra]|uniref:ATP dependent helicase, Lhr family n=1 Tax=Micromonospora auratinigra TaxID=261654 RepID=A0A1A9AAD8_9ACTN|nr:DEAD/DEAH box helicase [Micromonospora auratinigra]SBT53447.1 ATP dependent helicase, Lhr family [Micromonospora auratinigra]